VDREFVVFEMSGWNGFSKEFFVEETMLFFLPIPPLIHHFFGQAFHKPEWLGFYITGSLPGRPSLSLRQAIALSLS
jgi:hypothetical protein